MLGLRLKARRFRPHKRGLTGRQRKSRRQNERCPQIHCASPRKRGHRLAPRQPQAAPALTACFAQARPAASGSFWPTNSFQIVGLSSVVLYAYMLLALLHEGANCSGAEPTALARRAPFVARGLGG